MLGFGSLVIPAKSDAVMDADTCGAGVIRLAQQAPPTDYHSGVLGPQDHRVPVISDHWPRSSIGRLNDAPA